MFILRGLVRRVLLLIVLLVALLLGASAVLESFAENRLSTGVGRTLGLKTRPVIQVDAFPIIVRVIQGRIPGVTVEARDFVAEDLEVAELRIDMVGVRAGLDVLLRSDRFDLSVEEGEGSARITENATNAFLKRSKVNVHATLRSDGSVFVRADRVVSGRKHRFEATGSLALAGRTLTFKPQVVTVDGRAATGSLGTRARRETTFSVELPELPGKLLPTEVVVTEGELTLVASLKNYLLRLD